MICRDCKKEQLKLKQRIRLAGLVRKVDCQLSNQLARGYKGELKEDVKLPQIYNLPFAVVYGEGEMMLLWTSTQGDFEAWTTAFKLMIPRNCSAVLPKRHSKNGFICTLYRWLQPESSQIDEYQGNSVVPALDKVLSSVCEGTESLDRRNSYSLIVKTPA